MYGKWDVHISMMIKIEHFLTLYTAKAGKKGLYN